MFDIAVVTCHFNWVGFKKPVENLHRFMSLNPAAYGTEAYLSGTRPVTCRYTNWVQLEANPDKHVLFQKEALFNLTVSRLPPYVSKVAFVDADLVFSERDWLTRSSEMLDYQPIIQPFSHCMWRDRDNKTILRSKPSCMAHPAGLAYGFRSHPGFAWAARRTLWTSSTNGLYPYCFVGSGDTALADAVLKLPPSNVLRAHPASRAHWAEWSREVLAWTNGAFSHIPGTVSHMYHGSIANRGYGNRHDLAKDVDVQTMLRIDEQGLLSWTDEAPESKRIDVFNYFKNRDEDDDGLAVIKPMTPVIYDQTRYGYY